MSQVLHTQHLRLRPCTVDDLDAVHRLWIDPDIRRFLFDDRSISRTEASDFLAASVESFAHQGYGLWLYFEQGEAAIAPSDPSPTIAGFSGLLAVPEEPPSLIFGTQPQLWGRGYAKEATAAVLRYAFHTLGLNCVVADVDAPNLASVRVLEGLGMVRTGTAIVNDRPLIYYKMEAFPTS